MTAETVVGSALAYDCAVKPLTSLAAEWGKWLFTGCIPIEATIDNVQLYFSQFGYVLDVYLAQVERKMCHRGFGFVTFSDEIQLSTLLRKYIGYVGRCVYVIMIYDRQVLWSNRYSCGYLSIKGKSLRSFLCRVVWCDNVYHRWSQRNSRIHGEVKTEEIKVKRMGKDAKFRMMFKGNHREESYLL